MKCYGYAAEGRSGAGTVSGTPVGANTGSVALWRYFDKVGRAALGRNSDTD